MMSNNSYVEIIDATSGLCSFVYKQQFIATNRSNKINVKEEIENLDKKFSYLIKGYGCNTHIYSMIKSLVGYKMTRKCEIEECSSFWTIEINMPKGDGTISCNFKCDHSLPSDEGKNVSNKKLFNL